ncbi:MAG: ATP-binding protein [Caldilinea sp.]
MSTEKRTHPQRLRTSLDTRLIVAIAAMVLLSLLAANMAAFLILRDQLDRHSASSLRQGQRTATLALAERRQALDAHVAVLSQRPTLRRFLAEEDFTALASFLDDFRVQSDLDWIMVCDSMQAPLAAAGEPNDASLCAPQSETGYRLVGDRPVLMARAMVAENDATSVVAGQWIDAGFLQTLVDASSLEQSVIDPDSGRRLISTWPVSAADAPALSGIAEAWTDSHHRLRDTAGVQYEIAYARMSQDVAPRLWLESALPVSERLAAERRILALLVGSTALAALVLIGVAVAGVRRVNEPVVDALRRSEDAVIVAQAERIAALESLDALIQSIVEGVIMADDGGTVRFASAGAGRILKTPAERATGMALDQLLLLADGSPFPADDLLTNLGRGQLLDLRVQSGETITAAVSATRINRRTDEGQLNAYILRDVTEEEAHNRLRSYFLSSISHEFRTPLSTLKASLELLVGEENPLDAAESRQLLRPAYLSVVGLQTLIDNLLTSSTIEAGHFTLHLADADLSAILADAVRVVTPLLERRHQELIVELPAAPPIVRGDVAQLTQVLINLLTNAIKYSPTGSAVEVVIAHHATQTGSKIVRVSVADEGPGIAPGERVGIFRRFVRHHDNEREQYGVGLGLYVAKTTIVAHGGRIDVEDRPGAGSIFWFELPVGE